MGGVDFFRYGNIDLRDLFFNPEKKSYGHFQRIVGDDYSKAAQIILNDKIDILVDLAGHSWGNWLGGSRGAVRRLVANWF